MYILVVLAVILLVFLSGGIGEAGVASLSTCIDSMSLILILIIVIPVMASMGMLKDFNRAFMLTLGKRRADSLSELRRAKLAIKYFIRCSLFAGAVGTLIGAMQILAYYNDDLKVLTMALGIALCSLLYAFVIALVLLPIEAKLEQKIVEFMESEE